jgi:hypothetical protein
MMAVFADTLSTQIYDSALWQHESFWREVAGQPSAFPRALCAERRAERVVVWMDVSSRLERHSGAAAGMFRAGSASRVRNPRQQDSQRAVKERETNKDKSSHACLLLRTRPEVRRGPRGSDCWEGEEDLARRLSLRRRNPPRRNKQQDRPAHSLLLLRNAQLGGQQLAQAVRALLSLLIDRRWVLLKRRPEVPRGGHWQTQQGVECAVISRNGTLEAERQNLLQKYQSYGLR